MGKKLKKSRKLTNSIAKTKRKMNLGGKPKVGIKADGDGAIKRPRSERALNAVKVVVPQYFVAPVYGDHCPKGGATSMKVTLGPAGALPTNYGSTPASNTPPVMRKLLNGEYNHFGWIAGHLLNDNMGGPGIAKNLTPLTTAGNKNHLNACETKIKNFLISAYSHCEFNKSDPYWYGVEYEVTVGDDKWDVEHVDLQYVAQELRVSAKVVKMHKLSLLITDALKTEVAITSYFNPIINAAVDNTGYDQI